MAAEGVGSLSADGVVCDTGGACAGVASAGVGGASGGASGGAGGGADSGGAGGDGGASSLLPTTDHVEAECDRCRKLFSGTVGAFAAHQEACAGVTSEAEEAALGRRCKLCDTFVPWSVDMDLGHYPLCEPYRDAERKMQRQSLDADVQREIVSVEEGALGKVQLGKYAFPRTPHNSSSQPSRLSVFRVFGSGSCSAATVPTNTDGGRIQRL